MHTNIPENENLALTRIRKSFQNNELRRFLGRVQPPKWLQKNGFAIRMNFAWDGDGCDFTAGDKKHRGIETGDFVCPGRLL